MPLFCRLHTHPQRVAQEIMPNKVGLTKAHQCIHIFNEPTDARKSYSKSVDVDEVAPAPGGHLSSHRPVASQDPNVAIAKKLRGFTTDEGEKKNFVRGVGWKKN